MTTMSASIHIWVKTVFINFILIVLNAVVTNNLFDLFDAIVFLVTGLIATVPLMLFVNPVVILSKMFTQYGIPARMAWLTYCLMLMVLLFYWLISLITADELFKKNSEMVQWVAGTMVSLVISMYINRKNLKELYEVEK